MTGSPRWIPDTVVGSDGGEDEFPIKDVGNDTGKNGFPMKHVRNDRGREFSKGREVQRLC